ncbi:MAG: hypothetical protein ACPG7F_15225, partial [Aggregatilineales bacterium]
MLLQDVSQIYIPELYTHYTLYQFYRSKPVITGQTTGIIEHHDNFEEIYDYGCEYSTTRKIC